MGKTSKQCYEIAERGFLFKYLTQSQRNRAFIRLMLENKHRNIGGRRR